MDIENGKTFLFPLQCCWFHDGTVSPLVMVHNNSLSNAHHVLSRCMITYIHACVQSLSTHTRTHTHPRTQTHMHTYTPASIKFYPKNFQEFPKNFPYCSCSVSYYDQL